MQPNHNTELRDRVWRTAPADWESAKKVSLTIPDPWFRCQALTFVAQSCPLRKEKQQIAQQALKAAHEIDDPNRLVTIASWPLTCLIELESEQVVSQRISKLLGIISAEKHPVRRMDALVSLLWTSQTKRYAFLLVWPEFKSACAEAHSWRTDMQLGRLVPRIDKQYQEFVPELLEMIWSPKMRRKAKKKVAEQN